MISATVYWACPEVNFDRKTYSRAHQWEFDGGVTIPASSSPDIVPPPMSDPSAVDPEEAFVASISSCHMLWFLAIATKAGFVPLDYRDNATGELNSDAHGKLSITLVTLRPILTWASDKTPTPEQVSEMHDKAHHECFIANSVTSEICIEK